MKRLVALTTAALLLAACSQGLPTQPGQPGPVDLRATLTVDVAGLPAGQAAAVTVAELEGHALTLAGPQVIPDMPLGRYAVSAAPVTAGDLTYTPSVDVPSVQFDAQHLQQTVHVTYAPPRTGSLTVHVAGLPAGASSTLHLTAPDGHVRDLAALDAQTLPDLAPGTYTLTADAVQSAGTAYTPAVDPGTITVEAGRTVVANVTYVRAEAPQGAVSVRVTGLPSGAPFQLVVTDALGHPHDVTGASVLTNLPPGVASVPAQDVRVGDVRYHTSGGSVTVVAGQGGALTVAFQAVSGALRVVVNSPVALPDDLVHVGAPTGAQALRATSTLPDLAPGSYSVTAQAFTQGGFTYTPSISPEVLAVQAGLTAGATVTYTPNAVGVGVTADVTPPQVTLDASDTSAAVTGTATDAAGPVRVQAFDGTTLLGTVEGVTGPWQLTWAPTPGDHALTVIATDGAGNTAQTAATIHVNP